MKAARRNDGVSYGFGRVSRKRGSEEVSDRRRKLTPAEVERLRRAYASGETTMAQLAKQYQLGVARVWKIIHGLSYKESSTITCPHCRKEIFP